jgi:threonine/homoserine/homoserine lactone efflux protein
VCQAHRASRQSSQWVNPKAWLVCAGAVGTLIRAEAGHALGQSICLTLLFMLAALPCCFVWLAAGSSVQQFLRTERSARIFNLVMGAMLAGSILMFIW